MFSFYRVSAVTLTLPPFPSAVPRNLSLWKMREEEWFKHTELLHLATKCSKLSPPPHTHTLGKELLYHYVWEGWWPGAAWLASRTPGVFLFWLLQMECSGVTCHSRAPALATAQTNIITASPHSKGAHPFPNPSSNTQARTPGPAGVCRPGSDSQKNIKWYVSPFFHDSLDSGVRASDGKITSRRTQSEMDGKGFFWHK